VEQIYGSFKAELSFRMLRLDYKITINGEKLDFLDPSNPYNNGVVFWSEFGI